MPTDDRLDDFSMIDTTEAYNSVMTWQGEVRLPKTHAPRLNRQKAASHALALCNLLKEPQVAEAFEALPERFFEHAQIERLHPLALALWHQGNLVNDQKALKSYAKLPAPLAKSATELRNNLFQLVTYHLSHEPEAKAVIASIKSGTGYIDLASDLSRLASLVKQFKEKLSRDPLYYTETCADEAQSYSQRILTLLNSTDNNKQANVQLYQRLWDILFYYYSDICTAADFLFRRSPLADRFSKLGTLLRKSHKARKDEDSDGEGIEEGGAEGDATKDDDFSILD